MVQPSVRRPVHGVLVVEDDPIIQNLITEAIGDDGFEVRCANNGAEGLAILDIWTPDVILLDVMMPVMDGFAFRAAQRLHPSASRVPVVVMTARPDIDRLIETLQAAAALPKPFAIDYLLATVNQAVGE